MDSPEFLALAQTLGRPAQSLRGWAQLTPAQLTQVTEAIARAQQAERARLMQAFAQLWPRALAVRLMAPGKAP